MIDPEIAVGLGDQNSPGAGRRVNRVGMGHDDERAEAAVLDQVQLSSEAVDPRARPRDRKRDRRVEKHPEVVAVVGALREVAEVGHEPAAECLLDAELSLIPDARRHRVAGAEDAIQPISRRQEQVLVVRRLHRPAV